MGHGVRKASLKKLWVGVRYVRLVNSSLDDQGKQSWVLADEME